MLEEAQKYSEEYPVSSVISSITLEKCIPISVLVELTRRCNLDCQHCYRLVEKRKEISTERIFSLLDELKEMGTLFVTFSGGEITLHRDFLEIVNYANKKKFCLELYTNGKWIDEKMADEIAQLNVFYVGISLYSIKPETHDSVTRVKGSWDKSIAAAKLLVERNVPTAFKFVVMQCNVGEFDDMQKLGEFLGVEIQIDYTVSPTDDGSFAPTRLKITDFDLHNIIKKKILSALKINEIDIHKLKLSCIGHKDGIRDFACSFGRTICAITSYGDVYPCIALPKSAGNVLEKSFKEIWQESPFLKQIRNRYNENLTICQKCELRDECPRCPGLVFVETGDIYASSSESCRQAKISHNVKLEIIKNSENLQK